MKKQFIKNFIILTISTLIINIIQMITNVYITNKIGTTVLGSYSLITNIFNFLITISLFAIPLAITKIVSENDILKNNEIIYSSSKIACKISAIISVAVCVVTILFKDKITAIFLHGLVNSNIFILLSLSLPFIAITSCICGYFNALRKVNKPIIYEFLSNIIKSFVIIILLNIKFQTYFAFALGLFVSEITSFIYIYILYLKDVRNYKTNTDLKSKSKIILNIFRISAPLSFTSFIRSGLSTLKHTLIPLRLQKFGFSYEYALSRYGIIHAIALPFILLPSIFINSFASLLLPEFSRYYASKNTKKIISLTQRIFKYTILVSLYISFVIYISSDYICFKLYKNVEVSYYVKILTPSICIMYLDFVVDSILKGLDLQVNVMKINIIDLVISITLIYYFIPYLGTWGYILVLYVSEYINGILSVNQILNNTNISFKYYNWLILPLIAMFSSLGIVNIFSFSNSSFLGVIYSNIFFTIGFLIIYLILNKINCNESA